jgi:hypothetical protein
MNTHLYTEAANIAIRVCNKMQDLPDAHAMHKIKTALVTASGSVFYITDNKMIFRFEDGLRVYISSPRTFVKHLKFFIAIKPTKMRVFTR